MNYVKIIKNLVRIFILKLRHQTFFMENLMECQKTIKGIENKLSIQQIYDKIDKNYTDIDGYCFYKYPLANGIQNYLPDIVIIAKNYGFLIIESLECKIEEIQEINEDGWLIYGELIDHPIDLLDDYEYAIKKPYESYRFLRNKLNINKSIILPNINEKSFEKKFPKEYEKNKAFYIFDDYLNLDFNDYWQNIVQYDEHNWISIKSITQGVDIFTDHKSKLKLEKSNIKGDAIKSIQKEMKLLDNEQFSIAIKDISCPHRIRGLAGTGKTIVLAQKAANHHRRYPKHKILYTFNTQSLYDQVFNLVLDFYKSKTDKEPNWENLKILHSWGGRYKEGVYYRACVQNELKPLSYGDDNNFNNVCNQLLDQDLKEEYDLVLMDEAQDFPKSFYKLIYKLTKTPKRIVWAYDELQSLENIEIPDTGELFGFDEHGKKLVDLNKLSEEHKEDTDLILKKSYRNPLDILMLAHSIGLGIYNKDGIVQMIDKKNIWESIGYEIVKGDLIFNQDTKIKRLPENSPNLIQKFYTGSSELFESKSFEDREEEINWIAESIERDIEENKMEPNHILVISFGNKNFKDYSTELQNQLYNKNILSLIPGISTTKDQFIKKDFVTISTVSKAKGNEAFKVYIMNFDNLYTSIDEVVKRNQAFISISRAKGWCILTGIGNNMERAVNEIKKTKEEIPYFKFPFPDMKEIKRKLSNEEYQQRVKELKKTKSNINEILNVDSDIIQKLTEDEKKALIKKLTGE